MKKNKRFFFIFLLTSILAFYFAYILYSLLYKKIKPELSLQMLSVFLKEPNFKYYVVICETMTLPILLRMSLMPNLDINEAHHGSSKWENEKDFKKRVYTWDFKEKPYFFEGQSDKDKNKNINRQFFINRDSLNLNT